MSGRRAKPTDELPIIGLTEHGRTFLDARRDRLVGIVIEIMFGLPDEELEDLSNTLSKLRDLPSEVQEAEAQTD